MSNVAEHPSFLLCTVGAKVIRNYLRGQIKDAGFATKHFMDENKKKAKKRNFSDARRSANPEESRQADLLPFQLEILNATVSDSPNPEYFDMPILMNLLSEAGDRDVISKLVTARDVLFEFKNPTYAMARRQQENNGAEFVAITTSMTALGALGFDFEEYQFQANVKYFAREELENKRSLESWYFQCYGLNDQVKMDITDGVLGSLNLLKVSVKKL